jgi:hypothetical protein
MARGKNRVSPEVASELVVLAQQVRKLIYGTDGIPVWGTKFSEIESDCLNVGNELGRLMIEQSVAGQAGEARKASLGCPDKTVPIIGTKRATVETPAGEVHWDQPKARLSKARRDFFPSGEGLGD